MPADVRDTIVALSSAPGPGGRAIVRVSGPNAAAVAAAVGATPCGRGRFEVELHLSDVHSPVPASLLFWPGPRSATGDDLAELHLLSSPPLVERLIADLLRAGARAAQGGEFTLRAFLAGKLDLPRAEAVLGVIEAGDRDQLQSALTQLAGGVSRPLTTLRDDLLNLLADLEAGMDFADEDISFVESADVLSRLAAGLAHLALVRRQLAGRAATNGAFRVAFVGPPNAGKSSLVNALGGGGALVSPEAGTTRDYLVRRVELDGMALDLIDTAGWDDADAGIAGQAQQLSREQASRADLIVRCAIGGPDGPTPANTVDVSTQSDRVPSRSGLATSATTGAGLATLRTLLCDAARRQKTPALAPSLSRCEGHAAACFDHLKRCHESVVFGDPAEVAALELRGALDELGAMVGAVYTDDLLDRIFSRFCIGK